MQTTFLRKPSGIESFFIDLDECGCNMTFHFFLKLNKKPNIALLNNTMKTLLEDNRGLNLKYENEEWHFSNYFPKCKIRHVDSDDLNDYKPQRLNYYKQTVGFNLIHLKKSDAWHLCFDFFHGAVDGRSGISFIYSYFNVLNGRETPISEFLVSDLDIVDTNEKADWHHKKHNFTVIAGCEPKNWEPEKDGEAKTYIITKDSCASSLAPKLSLAVGKFFSKKTAKVIIPVDIRRFASSDNKTLFGNLFIPIFIDATTLKKVEDLRSEIIDYVKHKPLLMSIAKNLDVYTKISPKLRRAVIKFFLPIVMSSHKFIYGALVSPLGKIDNYILQSDRFKVEDVNVTFISFPFTAFSVISLQYNGHTNTTVGWHSGRVPQNIAAKLIKNIEGCIA